MNQMIRDNENAALQHTDSVLHHYQQNKQLGPQTFVTTYTSEENIFPQHVGDKILSVAGPLNDQLKAHEDEQKEARKQFLIDKKKKEQRTKDAMKPLGKNHHVRAKTRDRFKDILEEEFGKDIESIIKEMKPREWRIKVVRKICDPYSINGEELRNLWKEIYLGDLKFGVRDYRRQCLDTGGYKSGRSRNCFIARALKNSLESHLKRLKKWKY